MATDIKVARNAAITFVTANLAECCAEEIEWQDTGILYDGKLRAAAKLFAELGEDSAIPMTQNEIARQAMLYVIAAKKEGV